MADITMCQNKECPLRENCYRFKAVPDPYWQSYADFKPNEKGECKEYWPIKEERKEK